MIADFRQLRDFLHSEGERVRQQISGYLQLSRAATDSTKIIVDNIAQWKEAAVGAALTAGRSFAGIEEVDVTALPEAEKPPAPPAGDIYSNP